MSYKKQFTILGIIAISALIIFNIYWFGWKKLESSIYQKGVMAGRTEINNLVISQFLTTGKLGLTLPVDNNGKYNPNGSNTVQIILIPQINSTNTNQ